MVPNRTTHHICTISISYCFIELFTSSPCVDKHQFILQVDTINPCGYGQDGQITQNYKFAKSLQYLKNEVRHEVFYKLILYFWWVWPGMAKVLKIISMQCLCNIWRKNWIMKLMFCMLINMKVFYKLVVLFLMCLARHAQSTRVNLQYLCGILSKKSGMKLET